MSNLIGRFLVVDRVYVQTQPPILNQALYTTKSETSVRNSLQFDRPGLSNSSSAEQLPSAKSFRIPHGVSGLFGLRLQGLFMNNVSSPNTTVSPSITTITENATLLEKSLSENATFATNTPSTEATTLWDVTQVSEKISLRSHHDNLNNRYSSDEHLAQNSKLCGFIGYCESSASETCMDTPINSCKDCSQIGAVVFLFIVIAMGLAILLGNSLIVAVGVHRHRKGKTNKMDICRTSLAVADFFTGIQTLVITIYNYSWSTSLTGMELDREQLLLRGSVLAHIGAALSLFGYTSSLYHLSYIGLQRVYAITKPFRYRRQTKNSVYIGLGIVWILSLVLATVSAWLPHHLTSTYVVSGFLYLPTVRQITKDQSYTSIIALFVIFFCVPYVMMTILTAISAALIRWNYLKKTYRQKKRCKDEGYVPSCEQNTSAFKTVAIMQLGFSLTLVPILIIAMLYYLDVLDCSNLSTSYLVCVNIAMFHSLVNIIVYSKRNENFRSSFRDLLSASFFCYKRSSASSSPNKSPGQPRSTDS